jgi:hypothetical protein
MINELPQTNAMHVSSTHASKGCFWVIAAGAPAVVVLSVIMKFEKITDELSG